MKNIIISGFSDEITPDFDRQLEAVREMGLTHIELRAADGVNVSDFSPYKLGQIRAKLLRAGVKVSSIGSPMGKISIEDSFYPQMEKFKRTLDIQKELGAPYMRIFSFYIPQGSQPQAWVDEVMRRMAFFTQEAARWDAVLLHENEKGIYGDNARRCLDLMEEFYGPHFQAVFDFSNFVEVGQDPLEAYGLLKPYIAYIHVKDCLAKEKRVVPAGQGDGHLPEILGDLLGGGWEGFLSLEPHLTDFSGLALLEKDPKERPKAQEEEGRAAFQRALEALKTVLVGIQEGQG